MFVSHGSNSSKKAFQKPNILRKRSKVPVAKPNISESPQAIALVTTNQSEEPNISDNLYNTIKLEDCNKTVWVTVPNNWVNKHIQKSPETDKDANTSSNASIKGVINVSKSLERNSLNIESFVNSSGSVGKIIPVSSDASLTENNSNKTKSCVEVTNNTRNIIVNNCKEQRLAQPQERLQSVIVATSSVMSSYQQPKEVNEPVSTIVTPTHTIAVDCYTNRAVKFKCDEPNCNKGFWSQEKLKKHKNSHNRQVFRTPTQMTYECPVKKVVDDGSEQKCPRTFTVRGELVKHLNEEHTLDEAQYRCGVCGRRFFWALGLRAHGASSCARGGLACAWPGCGRVFRLPCRLREHARAHTGDRPYLCRYPECGWAFRSASKLVRHARRHTDERRHACATCGRAFLRREHLRDHCARHHHPTARAPHLCTQPGCEQTFTNMSTLYMHMKKVHRNVEKATESSVSEDQPATVEENRQTVYLVSTIPDEGEHSLAKDKCSVDVDVEAEGVEIVEDGGEGAEGGEWHAARTHCTWPLVRPAHVQYALDDDAQVERAEGSSSDVYTVRSDLFLHGNAPIDEDSQQIVGAELSDGATETLDADLCLINAHPTIDLMQEELMYEDAADESSFRVLLMNGEELT